MRFDGPARAIRCASAIRDSIGELELEVSREQFEQCSQEQIVPAVQQVGMPAPEIQFFDIHNYLVAG